MAWYAHGCKTAKAKDSGLIEFEELDKFTFFYDINWSDEKVVSEMNEYIDDTLSEIRNYLKYKLELDYVNYRNEEKIQQKYFSKPVNTGENEPLILGDRNEEY